MFAGESIGKIECNPHIYWLEMVCQYMELPLPQFLPHPTATKVTKHPKQWAGGREIRGKCSNANYTMRAAVTRLEEIRVMELGGPWRWIFLQKKT
jgi:hypothetical protein